MRLVTLGLQIADVGLCAAEDDVGQDVRHAAVDLLGVVAIDRPDAALDVREGQAELAGGDGRRHGGVDVAVGHHAIRLFRLKDAGQLHESSSRKADVVAVGNLQMMIRRGEIEAFEERLGHLVVVVLAGVNQHFPDPALAQLAVDEVFLHEIRPGADHRADFHDQPTRPATASTDCWRVKLRRSPSAAFWWAA